MKKLIFIVIVLTFLLVACGQQTRSSDQNEKLEFLMQSTQKGLEIQLCSFNKIENAYVTLDVDNENNSANVALVTSDTLTNDEVDAIKKLVSNSFEKLDADNIAVSDQNLDILSSIE